MFADSVAINRAIAAARDERSRRVQLPDPVLGFTAISLDISKFTSQPLMSSPANFSSLMNHTDKLMVGHTHWVGRFIIPGGMRQGVSNHKGSFIVVYCKLSD
jgi:hypothetical protein